jgi:hypothetical protein
MEPELQALGSFFIHTSYESPSFDREHERIPAHRLVVEPLVAAADEIRVYACPKDSTIRDELTAVSQPRRGFLDLSLECELVRGRERFWNAAGWKRGAITLLCRAPELNLREIFRYCEGPFVWASSYQMEKGTPRSAIRYCRTSATGDLIAFSFSASGGIKTLNVFAESELLHQASAIAQQSCRRFKRFIEHNPGAEDEIVVDRMPYVDLV